MEVIELMKNVKTDKFSNPLEEIVVENSGHDQIDIPFRVTLDDAIY